MRARVAFVKFGGLSAGGTERWLQMMAANLPRDRFEVDYFYCDTAPYIGGDFRHPGTDPDRLAYMQDAGVRLIEFHVGAKDIRKPHHDWVDTDFWDHFDEGAYDLVQTAKAGPAEYPYHLMRLPVIEYVTLSAGVDHSASIALTIHLSQWQRRRWAAAGGPLERTAVIPIPATSPAADDDLRAELGIPARALVAGFHQRAQDEIFSPVPLAAFATVAGDDRWFVLMGGSDRHRSQAAELALRNVAFVDHSGDALAISRFLNTLDVFAHGRADGETFGAVLAEAMMHGLPCLSHRSAVANAQPETMGPAGMFAEDGREYAEMLERLLSDGDLRGRLAQSARPHAEAHYSLEASVERLGQLYDAALTGARPAAPRRIAYGESDLGFLVAGDLDDPDDVARHVLTGGVPDEDAIQLLGTGLGQGETVAEAGAAPSLVGFYAAAAGGMTRVFATKAPAVAAAMETAALNHWGPRFDAMVVSDAAAIPDDALANAAIVVMPDPDWVRDLVAGGRTAPIVLARRADGVAEALAAAGYVVRPLGRGWLLGRRPEAARTVDVAFAAWRRERRARAVARATALPGGWARKARTRLGALVLRLRRRLRP